ncbi:MAG: tRNA pseudouridine(38-40) synthase TruA [Eubacteriales bacterium]
MRNIKLVLEYDGSRYQGWQRLGKGESTNTIANKIIDVLHKMTNENIEIFSGCRTEVGVHAQGQVINFKTTSPMQLYEIKNYMNRYLPQDIAVVSIDEMPERFHASLNATSKTYQYRVSINESPSVFERKYVYHSFKTPDVDLMKAAATEFIGTHDFKHFSTVKRTKSTEKTIHSLDIYYDGQELQFTIEASDFLHNMNRMILGFILDIGLGKRKLEEIDTILNSRSAFDPIVPCDPKGLFLLDVNYDK